MLNTKNRINMNAEELKSRTKQFAIDIGRLTQLLPENRINNAYCNQVVRSSSSVGANYRAARRAKSKADHINKLKIVEEELDESLYFLEFLLVFNPTFEEKINSIYQMGEPLLRIIVATLVTLRNN